MNWFIDSTSSLDMSIAVNYGNSNSKNISTSSTSENGALRNESLNNGISLGTITAISGNMSWMKRLSRSGRRLSVNARTNQGNMNSNQLTQSTNTYFKAGSPVDGDTLDRQTKTINRNNSYGVNLSYVEPISKHLRFDLRADLDVSTSTSDKNIYNLDTVTKEAEYDSTYSTAMSSRNSTQNLTASVNYSSNRWNISSGLSTVMQQAIRTLANDDVQQNLLRYSPSLNATFNLAKQKFLRASFSGNTIQPSIDQLQPVPDNSNPLYIRIGNPTLRTAFAQNYLVSYTANDFSTSGGNTINANAFLCANQQPDCECNLLR
jgi:hypothetical protein